MLQELLRRLGRGTAFGVAVGVGLFWLWNREQMEKQRFVGRMTNEILDAEIKLLQLRKGGV